MESESCILLYTRQADAVAAALQKDGIVQVKKAYVAEKYGAEAKIVHGLCRSPKDQTYAHTGAEEHGEPGAFAVFRLGSVRPQRYVSVFGEQPDPQAERYEQGHGQAVKPGKVDGKKAHAVPCRRAE